MMKNILVAIVFLLTMTASSYPDETKGIVTRIIDGATFEVDGLGCVRLADVVSVMANSRSGLNAREFTRDNLMGTQVVLDIDDNTGQDTGGCWMCVVYKANANGTPNISKLYNKMYVDAGYGMIKDDPKTEFDPANWTFAN